MQPSDSNPGSSNVMGLVSGANVVLANTTPNGARNCDGWGGQDNDPHIECHININATIVAFNESFVTHYSQNTYNAPWSEPPYGDQQGIAVHGTSGANDARGIINLWGGIVQENRGYVVRNAVGPYNTNDIGYPAKNYNYDCNVKEPGKQPPIFPAIERCSDDSNEYYWIVGSYF